MRVLVLKHWGGWAPLPSWCLLWGPLWWSPPRGTAGSPQPLCAAFPAGFHMGLLGAAGLPSPWQLPPRSRGPLLWWRQPKKGLGHFHGNKSVFSNSAKRNCFYLRPLMTWTVHLLEKSSNKKALCCAVPATAL